jgi:hypothetical protein
LLLAAIVACSSHEKINADAAPDAEAVDDAGITLPCAPSGLSKGPWAIAMAQDSIVVRWETCRSGTSPKLSYRRESGDPVVQSVSANETPYAVTMTYTAPLAPQAPPDYAGTWYMHEARIVGLAAGTCYRYALELDQDAQGRFCTAHAPGEPIHFMAIGDTNPGLGTFTRDVLAHVIPRNPEFIVHGGDVQYYASALETWASWFPVMAPLLRQGAIEPATGNHEYEKPTEYAEYTDRFFGGAGFDGTDHHYRFQSGGVWFFMLDTEETLDFTSPQAQWLMASLEDASKKPGYRFSIVDVHRPFLTCGDSDHHPDWLAALAPVFDQYKVPLVLQAHMHGYERFEVNGRTFITTAGGGGLIVDPDKNVSRSYCNQRVKFGPYYHAMIFDVTAGMLHAEAISDAGETIDAFDKVVP